MLPMPHTSVWSSSARLIVVFLRASASQEALVVEQRVERVAGDVRDLSSGPVASGASAAGTRGSIAIEPKMRWSTKLSRTGPWRGCRSRSRCGSGGRGRASGFAQQHLAAHAEVHDERLRSRADSGSAGSTGTCRAARRRRSRAPVSRSTKSSAGPSCRRSERSSKIGDAGATVAPSTAGSRPTRTTSTSGSSGTVASAARRAAGVQHRPGARAPRPSRPASCSSRRPAAIGSPPSEHDVAWKRFEWSGPLSVTRVLRKAVAEAGRRAPAGSSSGPSPRRSGRGRRAAGR